jgi:4-alpha-glucanotransferase
VDLSLQEALEKCKCEQEATRVYEASVKKECSVLDDEADYDACKSHFYDLWQKALDKCAGIEPSKCETKAEGAYR